MEFDKLIAVCLTFLTAFKGLHEYVRQGRWTRGKYLIERLDVFHGRESVQIVCSFLDWNAVELNVNGNRAWVDDYALYEALQVHDVKSTFTAVEFEVRRLFDSYLDGMKELVMMCRTGLIEERDLRLHLGYWIDILNGKAGNKPPALVEQFGKYMAFYGYEDVLKFVRV
jgi:hypothetical protein